MHIKTRLAKLCIGWLTAGIIYILSGFITRAVWIVPETYIDTLISFDPAGIWLYLLFYIYIPYVFIMADATSVKPMSLAFVLSAVISGIVFMIIPSSIVYPKIQSDGYSAQILNFVMQTDTPQNCLPSLHGSLLTICTMAIWDERKRIRSFACLFMTLFMYYSIIQVRRHVFIDLVAGIGIGVFTYLISYYMINHSNKYR
jgi:membrane-associated phospholipid phosphatase